MRRVHVDFHHMAGSVVPAPTRGEMFTTNEPVLVCDESTEDCLGHVIGIAEGTMFIQLDSHARA